MFRSKPNVVSVCGGICRALPFASKRTATGFITKPVTFYSKGILFVFYLCLYSKGVLRRVILGLVFASFHFDIDNFASQCIYFDFSFFTTAIDHI